MKDIALKAEIHECVVFIRVALEKGIMEIKVKRIVLQAWLSCLATACLEKYSLGVQKNKGVG